MSQLTYTKFNLNCRILWKKNEVADYEATTFSIFYNNALFLTIVILSSFYLLRSFTPTVYPFQKCSHNLKKKQLHT